MICSRLEVEGRDAIRIASKKVVSMYVRPLKFLLIVGMLAALLVPWRYMRHLSSTMFRRRTFSTTISSGWQTTA